MGKFTLVLIGFNFIALLFGSTINSFDKDEWNIKEIERQLFNIENDRWQKILKYFRSSKNVDSNFDKNGKLIESKQEESKTSSKNQEKRRFKEIEKKQQQKVKAIICDTSSLSKRQSDVAKRIIGKDAVPVVFDWYVTIKRNGNFRCGGFLLNGKYVVTAAHCFVECSVPEDIATLSNCGNRNWDCVRGIIRLQDYKMILGGITYVLDGVNVFIHNKFGTSSDSNLLAFDLAVIKLDAAAMPNNITTCRISEEDHFQEEKCFGIGEGRRDNSIPILRKLNASYLNNIKSASHAYVISTNGANAISADGDSGSPVLCQGGSNDSYRVLGIFSTKNATTSILTNLLDLDSDYYWYIFDDLEDYFENC